MKRFLPLILVLFAAPSLFSQDCSTLVLTLVTKSNYNGFNIKCAGDVNGSLEVSASGGTAPYLFSVNESALSSSGVFSTLSAGDHTVTVRDGNNCEKQLVVNLTTPAALVATAIVTSNYNGQQLSCFGNSNGIITAIASGGATPYSYSLVGFPGNTSGNTTGIYSNLSAGTYSIKITDINGCNFITQVVTINAPTQLQTVSVITSNYNGANVSCIGASDGQLTVMAIGGTGMYTYSLNEFPANLTGTFTGVFVGLQAGGPYTVQVQDVNNCSAVSAPVIIVQPPQITATVVTTAASCSDQSDGTLTTLASGGTGGYSFTLIEQPANTSGVTSGTFTGLTAGTYSIQIRDVNSCLYTAGPSVIDRTTAITIETTLSEGAPQNCSDAQISAVASGGAGPYLYELNDAQNNSGVFGDLTNGSYTVHVTDVNNCETNSSPIIISQPSSLEASATVTSNYNGAMISCFGQTDGSITITATGGTGLTFQCVELPGNTTGLSTGTFTGLGTGVHTFTVSDENGCAKTTVPVVIVSPQALSVTGNVTSNYHGAQLTCFDAADGKVTLNAQGGTGAYTYVVVDLPANISGATSGVFNGLESGIYTFKVYDLNACDETTSNIILTAPAEISLQAEISPDNNGDDGSIILSVDGGTGPYTFLWNTESTQQNLQHVTAGEYEVEVTDANECTVEESFTVALVVGVDEPDTNEFTILFDTEIKEFYLTYTLPASGEVSVKIFDGKGALALKINERQDAGIQKQILSRNVLQRGMYIAHVRIAQKLYVKKFIVF